MAEAQRGRRRGSSRAAAAPQVDPLALTAPPTIISAARAFLQDPTRPVTPAEQQSRRLLQSSSYSNRPQTSGPLSGSHDFLSAAAAADGLCWGNNSQSGSHTDIWVAGQEQQHEEACSSVTAGVQSSTASTRCCSLPGVSRSTASAPTVQHPSAGVKGNGSTSSSTSSVTSSSARASRATSAGNTGPVSRLAALGALAPLRPGSALPSNTGNERPVSGGKTTPCGLAATATAAAAAPSGNGAGVPLAWEPCCSPAPSASEGWLLPGGEHSCASMQVAPRQESTSTEGSSLGRPGSGGTAGATSRGSSSCSSRSRLSSSGSEAKAPTLHDSSMTPAEAELEQLLREAADAADAAADGGASASARRVEQFSASSCSGWQREVLRLLQHIQALSLSPTDAPALLQHCSELQCLLNTAADWGVLHEWLSTDVLQTGGVSAPAATPNANSRHVQPCVDSAGPDSQAPAAATSLQGRLITALVRLVDSKKPDVLVKVGAMLMSITPPSSHLLLPATKLLYSLSKTSSNDNLFRHHGVLRPLLHMTLALSSALAMQLQQQHTSTSLLYCSGCLKNVSTNATNQKSLGRLGGVATMAQVVMDQVGIAQAVAAAQQQQQQTAPGQRPKHPQHEAAAQAAVQATAVLRNLAVDPANAVLFAQQQAAALQALVSLLQPFQHDPEVLLNTSRCLSKLSTYEDCRLGLLSLGQQQPGIRSSGAGSQGSSSRASSVGGRPGSASSSNSRSSGGVGGSSGLQGSSRQPCAVAQMAHALLGVQVTQPQQWNTGIRLAFALGQLTTFHVEARPMVAAATWALDALPQMILDLVHFCQAQQQQGVKGLQQQQQQLQQQQQQQQQLGEDFMIKLLRVLANLSTDRTIGPVLAAKPCTADALLAVLSGYGYDDAEELVLNATAALTNLAFYDTPSNKVLQADADVLLLALLPLLTSGSEEAMCEAAKAVGNLARASPAVRAGLVLCGDQQQQQQQQQQEGEEGAAAVSSSSSSAGGQQVSAGPYVLQSLVLLLDHGSWEVVCSVAGAWVNLAALPDAGAALSQVRLAAALTAALQRLQQHQALCVSEGQQVEEDGLAVQAAVLLLLQCMSNMASASAAAMSEAILGSGGARCAELSCSAEDLAGFSSVLRELLASVPPGAVRETAKAVQARLAELWGV